MCEHRKLYKWTGTFDNKVIGECVKCGEKHRGNTWEEVRLAFGRNPLKKRKNYKHMWDKLKDIINTDSTPPLMKELMKDLIKSIELEEKNV